MRSRLVNLARVLIFLIAVVVTGGCRRDRIDDPREDLTTRRIAGPDGERHALQGVASWYGKRFQGRKTACGEPFDMNGFTAAHRTLPFHTIVRVTDPETLKSVVVRINDRGPYSKGRVIDLSRAAASDLDMLSRGTLPVYLQVLEWGDGSRCR
jgi:rare lipoprotein A (peptidoglycan hydrolase)